MDEPFINDDNATAWPKLHLESGMLLARSVGQQRKGDVPKQWTKLLCKLQGDKLEFYGHEAAKKPLDRTTVTVVSAETLAPHPTIVIADDFELRVSPFDLEEFWAWFLSLRCGGGASVDWDHATAASNELIAALAARRIARGVTVRNIPIPLFPRVYKSFGWTFLEDEFGTPNLVIAIDSMDAMRFDGDAASLFEIGTDACIACIDERLGITRTLLDKKRVNESLTRAKSKIPFETLPIPSSSPAKALEAAVVAVARQLVLCDEQYALTCNAPTQAGQFSVEKELREQVADFLNHKYVNNSDAVSYENDESDEDSAVAYRQFRLCGSWSTPRGSQIGFERCNMQCSSSAQGAESKEVEDDDDKAYNEARELLSSRRVVEARSEEVDEDHIETELDGISRRSHEILGHVLDACAPHDDLSDAILLVPPASLSKQAKVSTKTNAAATIPDPTNKNQMSVNASLMPSRVCISEVSDDFVVRDMTSQSELNSADRGPACYDSHESAIALRKPMPADGAGPVGRFLKICNPEVDESESQCNAVEDGIFRTGEVRTADDAVTFDTPSIADLTDLLRELADRPAVASAIGSRLRPRHRRKYVASLVRGILSRYSSQSSKLSGFIAAINSRVHTNASIGDGPLAPPWPRDYLFDALVEVARGEDVVAFSFLIAEEANILPERRLIAKHGRAPSFVKVTMNDTVEDSTTARAIANFKHVSKAGSVQELSSNRSQTIIQHSSAHDEAEDEDSDYTSVEEESYDAEVMHLFNDGSGEYDLASTTGGLVDSGVFGGPHTLTGEAAARKRAGSTSEAKKSESSGLTMPADDCEHDAYALAMAVVEAACKIPIPKSVCAVWRALSTSRLNARAFLIESTLVAALQVRVRHLGGAGSAKLGAEPERPPKALLSSQSVIPVSRFPARSRRAVELLRRIGRCALWSPLAVRLERLRGVQSLPKSMAEIGREDRDGASRERQTQQEDDPSSHSHASGDDDVFETRSEYRQNLHGTAIPASPEFSAQSTPGGNERACRSAFSSAMKNTKVNSKLERRTQLALLADSLDAFENCVASVSLCQVEPPRRRFVMRRSEVVCVLDATANYALSGHSVLSDASSEGKKHIPAAANTYHRSHLARRVVLVDNTSVQSDACLSETARRAAMRLVSTFRSALIQSARRDGRDFALTISCPQAPSGDVAASSNRATSNPLAGQVAWLSRALADAIDCRQRGVRSLCRCLLNYVQLAEARRYRRDAMKIELAAARAKLSVLEQHAHLASARAALALRKRLVQLLGKEAAVGLSYKIGEIAQSDMLEARHERALMRTVFSPLNLTQLGVDVAQVWKESHTPDDQQGRSAGGDDGILTSQSDSETHTLVADNALPLSVAQSIEPFGQTSPKSSANDQSAEQRLTARSLVAP